jgi:CRP-like cAMP-binding protein
VVPETPVEVLRLFRHTLRRLVEREPALALRMLQGLAHRLRHVRPGEPVG